MVLNYWSVSDEGSNDLEELNLGIDATRAPPSSTSLTSGFSDFYHMLVRSDSTETIRVPARRMSPPPPPRPRHAELPSELVFASPGPITSPSKPKNSKPKNSKPVNRVPVPATPWTFSLPQWSVEDEMIQLSDNIHDGCTDLNPAFDYKYISKADITGHLTYQRIKLELLVSASQMAREDLERAPGANASSNEAIARAPLLIRHVRSLRDLPYFHAHGDKRELCVAFLTMVARKRGIGTLSVNRLGQNQTEVYRQIANQLEDDMRREYEQAYEDAKGKVRRFR